MIRTVIVDDESIIRNDIKGMLANYADIEVVGMCGSVREAVQLIPQLNPDLLLLDVQLSDGYSFDIFKALPEMRTPVIFITAFDNHAIRAIRIGALDYLLKPLHDEELDICSVICGNSSYRYLPGSITFYQHTAKPGDTASKMHAIGRAARGQGRPAPSGVVFHDAGDSSRRCRCLFFRPFLD